MSKLSPVVLTIAGFDPSSGAGVTADIKTIAAHGCYGLACITALTVQSTRGVRAVYAVEPNVLSASLSELASDFRVDSVHIGMLATAAVANVTVDFLTENPISNVVLDPVLRSSSEFDLLAEPGLEVLIRKLIPLATVVTPNLEEAARLTGIEVHTRANMKSAAEHLHKMGAKAIVITGGHLTDGPADLLSFIGESGLEQLFFPAKLVRATATHGTGCAFSTALSCHLAMGTSLREGVPLAQEYVRAAIAASYPMGQGRGPINHFYARDFRKDAKEG